jgi:Domain of Unknown Function (DUF1080)
MSRLLAASLGVVLCVSTQVARAQDNELTPEEKGAGWTLLFDGKTLDGWLRSDGKPSNRGVDHEAINPHRCGAYMLVFDKEFSNFELKCDFKVSPLCNSGIFVRTYPLTPRKNKDVGYNGIEVAIDDGIKEGYHATGAIYDLSPALVDATKPTGQWNHIEVKCDGPNITVDLNGKQVNSVDLSQFTAANVRPNGTPHKFDVAYKDHPRHGYIGLQDHGSPCWFKNIKLRELK